jgi:hypothetical protein
MRAIKILTTFAFLLSLNLQAATPLFSKEGGIALGKNGDIGLVAESCKNVYLHQYDWELDTRESYSKLKYKSAFKNGEKVKIPTIFYHMILRPKAISGERKESYLAKVNEFLSEKAQTEQEMVSRGSLKKADSIYLKNCLASIKNIQGAPWQVLDTKIEVDFKDKSFKHDISVRQDELGTLIELNFSSNPLATRAKIFDFIRTNQIEGKLRLNAITAFDQIDLDGHITGEYSGFSEFEKQFYYETVWYKVRTCRKYLFITKCKTRRRSKQVKVPTYVMKKLDTRTDISIYLVTRQGVSESLENRFYEELMFNLIETNFVNRVTEENSNHTTYDINNLVRRSAIKSKVSARVTSTIEKKVAVPTKLSGLEDVFSAEVEDFFSKKSTKCLIERNRQWISKYDTCLAE